MRQSCVLVILAIALAGCSATTPTGSTTVGGGTTTVNLSGTWSGGAVDSLRQVTMTWQLTQDGQKVAGTVVATTSVGAPVYTGGTVTGTLSGNTLAFTVAIPRGSIVDLPDCAVAFGGSTTDITATGMNGTYAGTDSCAGAFAGGRLNLVKQ
jgi:hypothetical protein